MLPQSNDIPPIGVKHAMRAGADDFVSKLSYIQEVLPILEKFKDRRHE